MENGIGDSPLRAGGRRSQLIKGGAAGELFETPGVSSIWLAPALSALPQSVEQILELGAGGQIYMRRQASERRAFQPDEISLTDCEAFARSLAPVRLAGGKKAGLPDSVSFLEGYRVSKVDQLDIGDFWQNARCEKTLSVPIGVRENGENYYLISMRRRTVPTACGGNLRQRQI